jgi:small subunit ribosomal protein S2
MNDISTPAADDGMHLVMDEAQRIITIRQLLECGVHFGHRTERWNPKMKQYIFGARNGVHIIDLQQTAKLLRRTYAYVRSAAADNQPILFVGTKRQAQDVLINEARRCNQYFVVTRWLGGTLTNWKTIRQSVDKLRHIEKMAEDGTYEKLTKKEVLQFERQRAKLERNLGGIKHMERPPAVMFIIDPSKEMIAVNEARILGIPVVAVADTNCNPDGIDYLIPGNDDAIRAIRLFCAHIADSCIEGSKRSGNDRAGGDGATFSSDAMPEVQTLGRRTGTSEANA